MAKENLSSSASSCVLEVLARKSGLDVTQISIGSRLLQDLGIDGDDAIEAILEISRRCSMDVSEFDPTLYSRSEPTLLMFLPFLASQKRDRLTAKRVLTVGDLIEAARCGRLQS